MLPAAPSLEPDLRRLTSRSKIDGSCFEQRPHGMDAALMKCLLWFSVFAALALSSCGGGSSRWSEADKTSLESLAVSPVSMGAGAYSSPVGNRKYRPDMPVPVSEVMPAPGNAVAGALGAVGAELGPRLIVEIGAAFQQSAFEKRYADVIPKASQTIPQDLPARIQKAVSGNLGTVPHFRGKIRNNSPHRFVIMVEKYRYVHAGKAGDETLVTPSLLGRFELTRADGKKLLSTPFDAPATSIQKPITAFANDRALASKAFDQAISNLALQAAEAVGQKLGETPGSSIAAGIASP